MRIAIDGRMIGKSSMHGIARYVYQLLFCLRSIGKNHQFFVLVNPGSPLSSEEWPSHISLVPVKSRWISFGEQWELPIVLSRFRIDLFHAPSFVAPLHCPCELVMTVHDLNHMVLPHFYTPVHQLYYQFFVRRCIQRSRFVLTVSQFSKKEIIRTLKIPDDKILVTYNGVSKEYKPIKDPERQAYVRELYQLPARFIFCLTNNKPHKNLHQLVKAFSFSNLDVPLVLASGVDKNLIRIAESYGKKHLLHFANFIEEEHLPVVYSMSSVFVYPSTYEGFGLPPLEAMACGVPVVVARSTSLPEVVGESGCYVDPFDYQDIADKLTRVLQGEFTQDLEKGRLHAQQFSWEDMTARTLAIYESCMVRPNVALPQETR